MQVVQVFVVFCFLQVVLCCVLCAGCVVLCFLQGFLQGFFVVVLVLLCLLFVVVQSRSVGQWEVWDLFLNAF